MFCVWSRTKLNEIDVFKLITRLQANENEARSLCQLINVCRTSSFIVSSLCKPDKIVLAITIDDYELDTVHQFTYLCSTITDNLSLDVKIGKRIGKAATNLARLTTRVWTNPKLTVKTRMAVYNACVISTLLYGNETWTTYAKQERRLNNFHMRSIHRILKIPWQDKAPNTEGLSRAGLPSKRTLLRQRWLRWLGQVHRMRTVSPEISCMASWPLEKDPPGDHSCGTVMSWSATWRLWTSTWSLGRVWQPTGPSGEEPWPINSKQERRSWHELPQRGGPAESQMAVPTDQRQTLQQRLLTHQPLQPQTPLFQQNRLGCYPWSTLTDGGLLIDKSLDFFLGELLNCYSPHLTGVV